MGGGDGLCCLEFCCVEFHFTSVVTCTRTMYVNLSGAKVGGASKGVWQSGCGLGVLAKKRVDGTMELSCEDDIPEQVTFQYVAVVHINTLF